jgi:hypothetical protein
MPSLPPPPTSQFELWFKLNQEDFGVIAHGIQECVKLYARRRGVMDADHAVRHASKVMNCFRRDRARRGKVVKHFPMHTLTKDLADAVGGLPVGIALSEQMFWRIHARALAIQQGRVPAPSTAVTNNNAPETKKAA